MPTKMTLPAEHDSTLPSCRAPRGNSRLPHPVARWPVPMREGDASPPIFSKGTPLISIPTLHLEPLVKMASLTPPPRHVW